MKKLPTLFIFFSMSSLLGMNWQNGISPLPTTNLTASSDKRDFENYKNSYKLDYEKNNKLLAFILNNPGIKSKFNFPPHKDTNDLIFQFHRFFRLISRDKQLLTNQQIGTCSQCPTLITPTARISPFELKTLSGKQKHISWFHYEDKKVQESEDSEGRRNLTTIVSENECSSRVSEHKRGWISFKPKIEIPQVSNENEARLRDINSQNERHVSKPKNRLIAPKIEESQPLDKWTLRPKQPMTTLDIQKKYYDQDMAEIYNKAQLIYEDPIFKEFYHGSIPAIEKFLETQTRYKELPFDSNDQKLYKCTYENCVDLLRTPQALPWHNALFHA